VTERGSWDLVERSNAIRDGADQDPNESFRLAKTLAGLQLMEHARRLAQHIHADPRLGAKRAVQVRQQWALWTSKNPDGPDDLKHAEALEILDGIAVIPGGQSLSESTDPETLGIAGGICKRLWFVDGARDTLERSLRFYERGVSQGIVTDKGYTAINAAFMRDVRASLDEETVPTGRSAQLRQEILDALLPIQDAPAWEGGPALREVRWFHETIAEAYFGLRRTAEATAQLRQVDWGAVEPWELETTARQFAALARLLDPAAKTAQDFVRSPVWSVVRDGFGEHGSQGADSLFAGKLGLALSGGGFRASFFHIGVLAALAEADMLRHVEVLSCVSGGSIVGAQYYLEVRKLLQEHEDGKVGQARYIEVVDRLADGFLAGVQKNIRTRVAASLWANLKMMFVPGYTRTSRLGELYEKHLYSRVPDADPDGRQERRLRKLQIRPKNDEDCKPKYDNWRRSDKVPILVLNATTVNTGHNWQFTTSWMGEPPSQIESAIDGNYRLRRMYIEAQAPAPHHDITLGQAVAASSCVPGLFTPLELRGLYPGITVRLVDGGVHDNQGCSGLLDQNCTVFIVSDASGQMGSLDRPPDGSFGVLLRSNGMALSRVRSAEYRELEARLRSGRLKALLFVHLKQELQVRDRDWSRCDDPKEPSPEALRAAGQSRTSYNVRKAVQEQLAGIRTDLDSFSDAEAYALMASGYEMIRAELSKRLDGFPTKSASHAWPFLAVRDALQRASAPEAGRLARLLSVSGQAAFKVWRLSPVLRVLSLALGVAVLGSLGAAAWAWRGEPFWSPKGLVAAAAAAATAALAGALGLSALVRLVRYRKTVHQIVVAVVLSLVGWIASWTHLAIFDRLYLERGLWPPTAAGSRRRTRPPKRP
jgi:predicted acylesterase/phospholipase RssA